MYGHTKAPKLDWQSVGEHKLDLMAHHYLTISVRPEKQLIVLSTHVRTFLSFD